MTEYQQAQPPGTTVYSSADAASGAPITYASAVAPADYSQQPHTIQYLTTATPAPVPVMYVIPAMPDDGTQQHHQQQQQQLTAAPAQQQPTLVMALPPLYVAANAPPPPLMDMSAEGGGYAMYSTAGYIAQPDSGVTSYYLSPPPMAYAVLPAAPVHNYVVVDPMTQGRGYAVLPGPPPPPHPDAVAASHQHQGGESQGAPPPASGRTRRKRGGRKGGKDRDGGDQQQTGPANDEDDGADDHHGSKDAPPDAAVAAAGPPGSTPAENASKTSKATNNAATPGGKKSAPAKDSTGTRQPANSNQQQQQHHNSNNSRAAPPPPAVANAPVTLHSAQPNAGERRYGVSRNGRPPAYEEAVEPPPPYDETAHLQSPPCVVMHSDLMDYCVFHGPPQAWANLDEEQEEPIPQDGLPNVFIGQLPKEWTPSLIRQMLYELAEVVPYSIKAHEKRTCCFVQLETYDDAVWVISCLNRRLLFDYVGSYWFAPDEASTEMLNYYAVSLRDSMRGTGLPSNTLVVEWAVIDK